MEQQQTNKTAASQLFERVQTWLPLLLATCMSVGIWLGLKLQDEQLVTHQPASELPAEPQKMQEVLGYINAKYVDNINTDSVTGLALASLLERLDPHSSYIPLSDVEEVHEHLEGNFVGVGIEFELIHDTVTIISALQGSPAHEVGLQSGDRIVSINDKLVAGPSRDGLTLIKQLKGKKGSKVVVGVLRRGESDIRSFSIIRAQIVVNSIKSAYMLDAKTGYIRIATFATSTSKDFLDALEKLNKQGMKDIVLDLRQNPGGFLEEATDILNQFFMEKNKLLVYTQGRTVRRADYKTNGRAMYEIGKVAVLIDEGSASASEIIAGAIQDLDRGIVVGRRSFGKGLVQEEYSLADGSALRLTVARYYTPSGRCVQRPYANSYEYGQDYEKRVSSANRDDFRLADSSQFKTASGRVVYGGGGIIPDYWVTPESTPTDAAYYKLLGAYVSAYSLQFVAAHRMELPKKVFDIRQFLVSDSMMKDFYEYAVRRGVAKDKKRFATVREYLRNDIRARIAQDVYGDEGLIRVLNETDPILRKATTMMRMRDPFAESKLTRRR